MASIVPFGELEPTEHSHEFVGAEHEDVPFSVILVHSRPGVGPKVHRHPYPEVFIVESGQATFQIGDASFVVEGDETDEIAASATRPPTATWDAAGKPGEYRVKVELRRPPDMKPRTLGHARIHVVRGIKPLSLELGPPVVEGTTIENLSPGGGLLPTMLTTARLHYEWDTGHQGAIEPPTEGLAGGASRI